MVPPIHLELPQTETPMKTTWNLTIATKKTKTKKGSHWVESWPYGIGIHPSAVSSVGLQGPTWYGCVFNLVFGHTLHP